MLYDIEQIKQIIPHREPMLLLTGVESENETEIIGFWQTTGEEEFFKGHYPHKPIVPGVLLIECMAQLGAVKFMRLEDYKNKTPLLVGVKEAKFKKQVNPKDKIDIKFEIVNLKSIAGIGKGSVYVDGKLAASATLSFFIQE